MWITVCYRTAITHFPNHHHTHQHTQTSKLCLPLYSFAHQTKGFLFYRSHWFVGICLKTGSHTSAPRAYPTYYSTTVLHFVKGDFLWEFNTSKDSGVMLTWKFCFLMLFDRFTEMNRLDCHDKPSNLFYLLSANSAGNDVSENPLKWSVWSVS